MKIAVFHELPKGGARRSIYEFVRQLRNNHNVDLYSTDEKLSSDERKLYSHVYSFPFRPKIWRGGDWTTRLYKDTIELIKLYYHHKKIAGIIDKRRYDIILVSASQYIEAPFIMRFLQTPFLFYCQDPYYRIAYEKNLGLPKELDLFHRLYEQLNRYVRKQLDRKNVQSTTVCLSPSEYIARKFSKTYKKRNNVVYYGVNTDFFHPIKMVKDIDIFYIGSHDRIDGEDLLKEMLQKMHIKPRTRTIFVEEEWIDDDVKLRELYLRSKVFFAPARMEGLGASIMEAMSCGSVVVAVNEAGHRELIIQEKTGYLVPRDASVVAKTIEELLKDRSQRSTISFNARREMVMNWTWKERTKSLERVLGKVATGEKMN